MIPEDDTKFGVLLLGAPGTGKTTFCKAFHEFLNLHYSRKHCLVNLDPANENISYPAGIDVQDLISLEDAMEEYKLGPNGGMLYCADFLHTNLQWLSDEIEKKLLNDKCRYFIFDLPGQTELYTNHNALQSIIKTLEK